MLCFCERNQHQSAESEARRYLRAVERKPRFTRYEQNTGKYEIKDIGADAKVVPDRGSVLSNADTEPVGGDTFGPQSCHNGDYALFFNNSKDDAAKRIAAYQKAQ